MNFGNLFNYGVDSAETDQEALQFLPNWNDVKWRTLFKYTQRRTFHKGEDIVQLGATDRNLLYLLDGQVEVLIPTGRRNQLKRTQLRNAGSLIGEQSFLEHKPRSATVRATTDGILLSISPENFEMLSVREPQLAQEFILDLARTLSVKLRQANTLLSKALG
ncbi:MAG: Crp/Fnr family transcriptional regulator [Candidatus Promineifilaceae bacterium]